LGAWGLYLHECVVPRRARTDKRWDAGVGAGGGKPGRNARVRLSLDVDPHAEVEPAKRGQHDTGNEEYRDGRSGEIWRRDVPQDQPPPEPPVRRV
jgi:hypothetical protein